MFFPGSTCILPSNRGQAKEWSDTSTMLGRRTERKRRIVTLSVAKLTLHTVVTLGEKEFVMPSKCL